MMRSGFTLAEVVVACAVVGVLLVASLTVVGSSATGQVKIANLERGQLLAGDMLAEVTAAAYEDADSPVWGPEPGEMTTTRLGFDDVDDYAGLVESPPVEKDGSAIPGTQGWTRSVVVEYVSHNNPQQVAGNDRGLKRVTVTVTRNGALMASVSGLRTRAHDRLCQ